MRSERNRTVEVTMTGPEFFSVVATDGAFCGGTHLNFQSLAFTFDLLTGKRVNWAMLLPPPPVENTTTEQTMEGTTMGLVRSKLLVKLDTDSADDNCGTDEDAELRLWPDAARGGVDFAWVDLPHADENFGEPGRLAPPPCVAMVRPPR